MGHQNMSDIVLNKIREALSYIERNRGRNYVAALYFYSLERNRKPLCMASKSLFTSVARNYSVKNNRLGFAMIEVKDSHDLRVPCLKFFKSINGAYTEIEEGELDPDTIENCELLDRLFGKYSSTHSRGSSERVSTECSPQTDASHNLASGDGS